MTDPKHIKTPLRYQEGADAYTHIVRTSEKRFVFQLAQDSGGEAEATARLIVRAYNLVLAGRALYEARRAEVLARGDVPPDQNWGLSENEVAAALMMNALIEETETQLRALRLAETALSHEAPADCWSTGPNTGDPIEDLVACPGCRALHSIRAAIGVRF